MKFCKNCFVDSEISSILSSLEPETHTLGRCPLCHKNNVYLYDTDVQSDITINLYLENLLSVYKTEDELDDSFPVSEIRYLVEDLQLNWKIFNPVLTSNDIENIIKNTVIKEGSVQEKYLTQRVGLFVLYDEEYINKFSILKNGNWDEFVEELKYVNRFHSNYIKLDTFQTLCRYVSKVEKKGKKFYRCRIIKDGKKLSSKKMGAPPKGISPDGRANSFGISRLYLTSEKETAVREARAAAFDNVCVGNFLLLDDLLVVDLDKLNHISPFTAPDISLYATNIHILNKINYEISKVSSSSDKRIDYVPAQFITDTIQSMRDDDGNPLYDGIKYSSTMKSGTYNLALFNTKKAACGSIRHYQISEISYNLDRSTL